MPDKRSARIIMTNEARVLREMRIAKGLSMRKAGREIGVSDSYIAHVETGRMDPPKGPRLRQFLDAYGGIKEKSFQERVRNYSTRSNPRDDILELLTRANDTQIHTLLTVAKGILGPQN